MEKTLKQLDIGSSAVVQSVRGSGPLRRRIFDMGITPGAKITVKKVAPLGDPIEISVRGYSLSLRKAEADAVIITG